MSSDEQIFENVSNALDLLTAEIKSSGNTSDWIDVSLPKLRKGASPFITQALDLIEKNEDNKNMFRMFVHDAVTKPDFKAQLKKSLSDPTTKMLISTLMNHESVIWKVPQT